MLLRFRADALALRLGRGDLPVLVSGTLSPATGAAWSPERDNVEGSHISVASTAGSVCGGLSVQRENR